jgi:hypothetical protein
LDRVGLLDITYKGLPITIPIVSAKYSAKTPNEIMMIPEKNDMKIRIEAHPCTGVWAIILE